MGKNNSTKNLKEKLLKRIEDRILKCEKCHYVWIQKNKKKTPKNCPKCNSPTWWKARSKKFTYEMIKGIEL